MKNEINSPILSDKSTFDYTEAFVRLRTNFIYITMNGTYKKVLFTSCDPSEGKSTVVLNLAISLAKDGKKVLMLDCDIRRSSVRSYLGLQDQSGAGLSEILCNLKTAKECIHHLDDLGFDLILSGSQVPNPSELLGSDNMRKLLSEMEEQYDYILLDCPPVLSVSDPIILSTLCDGVVFVVRQSRIRKKQYAYALSMLETVNARMLGVILGMYESKTDRSYGYGYGRSYYYRKHRYGYGYGYGYGESRKTN